MAVDNVTPERQYRHDVSTVAVEDVEITMIIITGILRAL